MKFLFFVLIAFFLTNSCTEDRPKYIVKNKTTKNIDSIIFNTSFGGKTKVIDLKSGNEKRGNIIIDDSIRADGSYSIIVYFNDGFIRKKNFGYYTNGKALNDNFDIAIKRDSINVSY